MSDPAPRILTTMWSTNNDWWNSCTDLLDRRTCSFWAFVARFVRMAPDYDAVIVLGSLGAHDRYIDLVATVALRLRRKRPIVVVTDATWEPTSAALAAKLRLGPLTPLLSIPAKLAIRLMDHPTVRYVVLSSEELESFPRTWHIDPDRVQMTTFSTTLVSRMDDPTTDGDYLFAGGNSLRNYGLLLEAVRGLDLPVRIAAREVPEPVPPNVEVGVVSPDVFTDLLLGCRLVVVPLQPSVRSAGQQTYLNAMAVGKPVIVTEAPGVHDLVRHRENGLIVPPDPKALRSAIEWVLDPANGEELGAMVATARHEARTRHTVLSYRQRIWAIAAAAAEERRSGQGSRTR